MAHGKMPSHKASTGGQVGPKWTPQRAGGASTPGLKNSGYAGAKPSGKPNARFSNRGK